ncbi:MAG: hypothetical protein LBQ68_08070 [Clostridiales bacterium]|jgi:hypothetical protein|nr:hypothetical protein [Clostridiales bacterium]
MKKIFALVIVILMVLTCSLPVFAAEESVPFIGGGALIDDENTTPLTDEEKQLRINVYNEIFALSKTDENIIAVKLSEDSRWVFWNVAGDPKTVKEYAKRFDKYSEFLIMTDDIDKAESNIGDNNAEGGVDIGGNTPDNSYYYLWIAVAFGILFLGAVFIFVKRKRTIPAFQTANGNVVTQNTVISKKEAILSVKQNETAPGVNVFSSILHKIDDESEK